MKRVKTNGKLVFSGDKNRLEELHVLLQANMSLQRAIREVYHDYQNKYQNVYKGLLSFLKTDNKTGVIMRLDEYLTGVNREQINQQTLIKTEERVNYYLKNLALIKQTKKAINQLEFRLKNKRSLLIALVKKIEERK